MYPYLSMLYASYVIKDPENYPLEKVPALIREDVEKIVEEMAKKARKTRIVNLVIGVTIGLIIGLLI